MNEHQADFAYTNLADRPGGRWLRTLGWVIPGVTQVQAQAPAYADAWREANLRALGHPGPLWIALGDSLSQGLGAPSFDRGWVGQLQRRLAGEGHALRVVNLSVSGARIEEVLRRQLPALEALVEAGQTPQLVTLLIGSNDLFGGQQRERAPEQLELLLDRLPGCAVVATLPNPSRRASALNAVVERRAARGDVVIADTREPRTTRWLGKLAADHFHPNELGHTSIADVFHDAVVDGVPLPGQHQ